MPYYEMLCDDGHTFEVEQRITEDALTECTFRVTLNAEEMEGKEGYGVPIKQKVCGAPCRRQLCKSSFQLRGGGWSNDGYARSGKG